MKTGRTMKLAVAMLSFFCMAVLTACAEPEAGQTTEEKNTPARVSMEEVAILDYSIPRLSPGILVNCEGYQQNGSKVANFVGESLPETFEIRESVTGQSVYKGAVSRKQTADGVSLGYGDFSDFSEQGEYYLFADFLGESRRFRIEEDYYRVVFEELYDDLRERCRLDEATVGEVLELLVSYEWYPELFEDTDRNKIPDALEMTAGWIERTTFTDMEAAAFLAKFSYLYKKYDMRFATQTLKKATTLYKECSVEGRRDEDCFLALTELYRATGLYEYRTTIEQYESFFEKNPSCMDREGYLYGAITYISTHQRVNKDLCELLLNSVIDKAREHVNFYGELIQPVDARNSGVEDLISKTGEILAVNYINNNYEYNRMLAKTWNYYHGLNENSREYMEEADSKKGFILLAAQLHSVDTKLWME